MRELFAADSTRAVLADWVESELVLSDKPFYTDALLGRSDEVERDPDQYESTIDLEAGDDGEEIEPEILQQGFDERREDLWSELKLREAALGQLYPFELVGRPTGGWRISLKEPSDDDVVAYARGIYLATLIMACFRNHHIGRQSTDPATYTDLQTAIGKQFQHISALAAPNLHGPDGIVFSFGWPRRDGSVFRDSLISLVKEMGRGKVKKKVPANASGHEKDGTVDIVVWRPFAIASVGDMVYYGQVASGENWTEKPVMTYLRAKFFKWFKYKPARQWTGVTFMPFVRHTLVTPHQGATMAEAMEQEDRDQAVTYGTMVDRIRLVELFGQGLGSADRRHLCEEPATVLERARHWVEQCRAYCAQAA